MIAEIEEFGSALRKALRASRNTVVAYVRDLKHFYHYLQESAATTKAGDGNIDPALVTADDVRNFLNDLLHRRASRATVQRALFAIKAFYRWRETTLGKSNPVHAG